jgi:hypothetical protein
MNVAANAVCNFVGGLGLLTKASILNGDQALVYNRLVSPVATVTLKSGTAVDIEAATDTVKNGWLAPSGTWPTLLGPGFSMIAVPDTYVAFASQVVYSAWGALTVNSTVPTESNAYYGSQNVSAAPGSIFFDDGGIVFCTLNGDQAFPHGAAFDLDVTFRGGELIQFEDGAPIAGVLAGDQWATTIDDLDGWVWLKSDTGVTFSNLANGNRLVSGTAGNSMGNYLYYGGVGGFSPVFLKEGDIFEVFPDTGRLWTATVYYNQTLNYGPSRTVTSKGSWSTLLFDHYTPWVYFCTAASNQTLTSAGGSVNVSANQELYFSGGYYTP